MPSIYNGTNGHGSIVWGGTAFASYGIVTGEAPAFDKPNRKQTVFNVPNRNGSVLFQQNAFEDVVRSYNIWIDEQTETESGGGTSGTLAERVSAFTAMLYSKTGYQELTDCFEPDIYRLAYFSGGNDFSNELTMYGKTTLSFTCRPERFLNSGKEAVTVTNGSTMTNPTLFPSKPLIHIEGTGSFEVAINGVAIVASVTDYINIDCERMNAYRTASENMNDRISGAFPNLASGSNTIAIVGAPTLVQITPKYFTI